jgi:hypothetical protein
VNMALHPLFSFTKRSVCPLSIRQVDRQGNSLWTSF